jgi:hypothetical protein
MSETRYEIRLRGHLDARWNAWFDGLSLTHEGDGDVVALARTWLARALRAQAASSAWPSSGARLRP